MTDNELTTLAEVGAKGALFASELERLAGGRYWNKLVRQGLVIEVMSDLGPVLALTPRGRRYVTEEELLGEIHPPYLAAPSSIIDRGYQMLVARQLIDDGFEIPGAYYKPGSKLTGNKQTDQIVSLVINPPGYTPPPLDQDEDERRAYPLAYAPLGQRTANAEKLKALYHRHRQQNYRWQYPVLLAIPTWTPELRRQLELLQERKEKQEVIRILIARPD